MTDPNVPVHVEALGDTGRFVLLEVKCESTDGARISRVLCVRAQCKQCASNFMADDEVGLTSISGAAVLICDSCGNRQAISQGIFEAFSGTECVSNSK